MLFISNNVFSETDSCKYTDEKPVSIFPINKHSSIVVCGYPYLTTNTGLIKLSAAESNIVETSTGKEYVWADWNESFNIMNNGEELIVFHFRDLSIYNKWSSAESLIYKHSFKSKNNKLIYKKIFAYKPPIIKEQEILEILNNFNEVVSNKKFNEYGAYLPAQLMVASLNGSKKSHELLMNFGQYVPLDGEIAHAYSQVIGLYKIISKDKKTHKK